MALAWGVTPCAAQPACPGPGVRIGRITIDRRQVFDTAPGDRSLAARIGGLANPLHVRTRERVVRGELLFREGDTCRDEALAQSERNLRARGLFQTVAITAVATGAGTADVRVFAQDAWTLRVSADAGRAGDVWTWEVGLADTNVAGEGLEVGIRRRQEVAARVGSAWTAHDRLFGTRERLSLAVDDRSDGDGWSGALSRPFFAIDSTWSHEIAASRTRDHLRLYDDGAITDEFARDSTGVTARIARRVGPARADRAWRLGVGVRYGATEVSPLSSPGAAAGLPPSHRYAGPQATLQFVEHRYVKRRGLIVPARDLDVNLGWQAAAAAWISLKTDALDTEARTLVGASVARGWARDHVVATASVGANLRAGGTQASTGDVTGSLRVWWAHAPLHTTAIAADVRTLVSPEYGSRLYVGGSSGLVGYREFLTWGTRTVVVQVEERRYFRWTLAGLAQFGVAAFAEAGAIGGPATTAQPARTLADAGFGLRIAQLKSSANAAVRLDVAFPFTAAADGTRRPLVVVGYHRSF